MNSRNRATLEAVFADPVSVNVGWRDVERLVVGVGGTVTSGRGSKVRFDLNGVRANFHRRIRKGQQKRYQVRDLRDFFASAGVLP